jgi:hypothetical protein
MNVSRLVSCFSPAAGNAGRWAVSFLHLSHQDELGGSMSNPFDDLQKKREAYEAEEKRKENERVRLKQKQIDDSRKRAAEAKKFDNMVIKVLEQLRKAFYPSYETKGWGIGQEESYVVTQGQMDGTYYHWVNVIEVVLEFDQYNLPVCFKCRRGNYKEEFSSDLSEEALILTLKQLHQ